MELGERRRRILSAVVHDYVETAEPVGSETLAYRHDFGVKPATIRNELAAMSDMGYLRQPHTSAGRVPSDLGYRYYVDRLMPPPSLSPVEASQATESYDFFESEVETILHSTCRVLSGLTSCTSLATPPQMDTVSVKHVALSEVRSGTILIVIVLNTGQISHKVLDHSFELRSSDLMALGNYLNEHCREADLRSVLSVAVGGLPPELHRLQALYRQIVSVVNQTLMSAQSDEVFMDGTSYILKQPEFADSGRAAWMLDVLERRRTIFEILGSALLGEPVTVIIGSENRFEEVWECSFVASRYSVGDRVCGTIGVVGPTRMDYRRAVAAVRFMASNLSQLLTWLSEG